jgi:L-arabinose isomerase
LETPSEFYSGGEAWNFGGGAHHTCYSENISAEQLEDFAEIAGIESLVIDEDTKIRDFKNTLRWNEIYYR